MSLPSPTGYYRAEAAYADLLKRLGLVDAMSVFEHPKIEVWRSITERENCVLDHDGGRLHIKRNKPKHTGVDEEASAIRLLMNAKLPTVPLMAAGRLNDGRGFLITDDLKGYDDGEVIVRNGLPFETILDATADLAGRLHAAGLHHRDLYLCHFYVDASGPLARYAGGGLGRGSSEVQGIFDDRQTPSLTLPREYTGEGTRPPARLMDAGRVKPLPTWFRRRWVVKDIAQFIYSVRNLDVPAALIDEWLSKYAAVSGTTIDTSFRRAIERKVAAIGRHDARLRARQPTRNVGIDKTAKGQA